MYALNLQHEREKGNNIVTQRKGTMDKHDGDQVHWPEAENGDQDGPEYELLKLEGEFCDLSP